MIKAARMLVAACAFLSGAARAEDAPQPETWSLHGQATFIEQYHPAFRSLVRGRNSLDPGSRGNETVNLTLYGGRRLWEGGEAYASLDLDQGFGLSNTEGVAGYVNGEGSKVGKTYPYFRLQRLFLRQTFDLGGKTEAVDADADQLAGSRSEDHIVLTAGKFAPTDIFDTNSYAHDPMNDFLNWAIIDSGAYDYAADAWGYSYGGSAEWTQSWWTLRAGLFDLSRIPNNEKLVRGFGQYELVSEAEERHTVLGRAGKLRFLAWYNRGRMGSYRDALALAMATHTTPDTGLVRRPATRPGFALNLEQELDDNVGAFARASVNDGSEEAYEYADINRSLAVGLSLKGAMWGRKDDTAGIAGVVNAISQSAQAYLAAGGLGILVGDGSLNYGTEDILEAYYNASLTGWLNATADYQFIANPAYNRDRGPVSVLGLRLHAKF
ncbi:MAG: carbohydrate porin [Alphaproteobacteria bacterium]|nr:carbohydrate porin [Alphaproteobacteria bacterium]